MSITALSSLLELLYSATLDDECWQHFLALLSTTTGSAVSVFLCADQRLGMSCRAQGGNGPGQQVDALAYNRHYVQADPFRAPCLQDPRPRIVEGEDLLPREGLLRTPLYQDLLAPHGFRYATLLLLTLTLRRIEIVTIWRTVDQGPMRPESLHLLNLIFPHMQKAMQIRQVLGVSAQQAAHYKTIADASPAPAFLLSSQGRLVEANASGRRLLEHRAHLTLLNGCIAASSYASQKVLRRLIDAAAAPASLAGRPPVNAAILHSAQGAPLQVLASPIPQGATPSPSAQVLLLAGEASPATFPDDLLRMLYRLTPAETDIANGLLMGYAPAEIASLRKVSPGTVRLQVKSILAKTSTSRQSDLVRLLMAIPHPPT